MDMYQLLAFIGGGMVVLSTLPQAIKSFKFKEVKDLSLQMFFLLLFAQIIWVIYGVHLGDLPITLTNALSGIVVLTNIILIFKYRKKDKI